MRLIVSGAGGFLGRNLVKRAVEEGLDVIAITGKTDGILSKYGETIDIYERFEYEKITIRDQDILINCAFPRSDDGHEMGSGLKYTQELLTFFVCNGIDSVINISSQSVYGSKRIETAKETDDLCLDTAYAVGKYTSELLTNLICKDVRHTNIRLASLIGVGFDQRFINKMVKCIVEDKKIEIKIGSQLYGFLDVRDASDAIIKLCIIGRDLLWRDEYNLGPEKPYSMSCIAGEIMSLTDKKVAIEYIDDTYNSFIDSSAFYSDTNWKPQYGISDTILNIYSYMKTNCR